MAATICTTQQPTDLPDSAATRAPEQSLSRVADELPRAPRGVPPRLVDGLVVVVGALAYIGFLASQLLIHGQPSHQTLGPPIWTTRTVLAAVCSPIVFSLWWRRRYPRKVLAVMLAGTVIVTPYPALATVVALYTAGTVLAARQALMAWGIAASCLIGGQLVSGQPPDFLSGAINAGLPLAIGLYVGTRRAYVERLRERALFARALASFMAPDVARVVESTPSALALHDEREASVLFSDIRGFSSIAEALPPGEVAQLVGRHVNAMSTVVNEHAGTLDKFAGDAVMATFGAPRRLEEHASLAVRCAIAMQVRQSELNAAARRQGIPELEIGIGVNTGMVFAGTIGGSARLDYTVLGDAVNIAQRLQSRAGPGEILASRATVEQAKLGPAEPLGRLELKGRREPVEAYRITWS